MQGLLIITFDDNATA